MRELRSSTLPHKSPPVPTLTVVLIAVVVIGGLYFGREVLVPIALALLLSFVLAPLVRLLEGWYVPRGVVISVVVFAFATIFGLGALMVSQVDQLAGDLPSYQSTLREKIQSLRGAILRRFARCVPAMRLGHNGGTAAGKPDRDARGIEGRTRVKVKIASSTNRLRPDLECGRLSGMRGAVPIITAMWGKWSGPTSGLLTLSVPPLRDPIRDSCQTSRYPLV
jgi:hypothetical protein